MSKRKLSRVNFKVDAVLKHNNLKKACSVRDLSLSGIYLLTDVNADMGEKVGITVKITSDSTTGEIELSGVVVRKDSGGLALEFFDLPIDSYLFLRNVVVYNSGDADAVDQEYRRHLASRKMRSSGEL